jgi:prolyl-tRNA editing enzyme YbaK/EbsC (Cys-tRNA(Pro) deacylase)
MSEQAPERPIGEGADARALTDRPASERVRDAARRAGLELAVQRFPEGTRTAAEAARAVGCEVGAICKSIVLRSAEGPVLVLTSGANRVDCSLVEAALDRRDVARAGAEEARAATGFAIGGTAPFGHPAPLPILLDRDLLGFAEIWAAAGTPDTVFPVAPEELRRATGAQVADVAQR